MAAELKVGDKAPVFESTADDGKAWKSADHVGKKIVVVYFYPADFTGGCTKQACSYRDDFGKLADKGVEVIGVSGDNVEGHQLFKAFHKLPFTLLSDQGGRVRKNYGVPAVLGLLPGRVTYVIDRGGTIVYDQAGMPTDDEILEALR